MGFQCIRYAAHCKDGSAYMAVTLLGVALQDLITATGLREPVTKHMEVEPVSGREPACATAHSVSVFTCETIAYPSRFFRIIRPENREKLIGHVPLWARSSKGQVAVNPRADLHHIDKQSGRNCFEMALLDLHRSFGGYHMPKRRRPAYVSGRKARMERESFIRSC